MGAFLLATLIKATVSKFNTEDKAAEVEIFFKGQDIAGAEGAIQQAIESIHNRASQLQRDLKELEKL
jgi:polyphosphate kinase 2 (PPK2 family)